MDVTSYFAPVWKYALSVLHKQNLLPVEEVFFSHKFSLLPLLSEIHETWKAKSSEEVSWTTTALNHDRVKYFKPQISNIEAFRIY